MLRKILAALLMGTTVSAQVPLNKSIVTQPASASAEVESSVIYRQNKIRPGNDMELAIIAGTPRLDCLSCYPTFANSQGIPTLETVILDFLPGFSFRYADRSGKKFKTTAPSKWSTTASGPAALIKIHADKNVKAGEYQLRGKARFRLTSAGTASDWKEIDLVIPVTVVAGNEIVTQNGWPYEPIANHSTRNTILFVLALPFLLPYLLILEFYCDLSSHCD
jgi:hypothetical protein